MPPILIQADGDDFGPSVAVTRPTSGQIAYVRVAADQPLPVGTAGFWECSPGRFRRQVSQSEYSYFISGKGSFTPDGGSKIQFQAGDAIYFAANTEGEWNIVETVRKAYVVFEHEPAGEATRQ